MVTKPSQTLIQSPRDQYRIGFSNVEISIRNPDEEFKVLCCTMHVTKAALYIGYIQIMIIIVFSLLLGFCYITAVTENVTEEDWIVKNISLLLTITVMMIYGVHSERPALFIPYLFFDGMAVGCQAVIALFAALALLGSYFVIFVFFFIATLIHAWCLFVIYRCYRYLFKKVHHPKRVFYLAAMPQPPPPYADIVIAAPNPARAIIKMEEDEQLLNVA